MKKSFLNNLLFPTKKFFLINACYWLQILEDLIHHNESNLQLLLETPALGEHYSVNWALQELVEAQEAASMNKQRRKHASLPSSQDAANLLKRSSRFGSVLLIFYNDLHLRHYFIYFFKFLNCKFLMILDLKNNPPLLDLGHLQTDF